ncbi:hypothetical protein IMG5_059240, partial [Ichthyophthirius multifiliis]
GDSPANLSQLSDTNENGEYYQKSQSQKRNYSLKNTQKSMQFFETVKRQKKNAFFQQQQSSEAKAVAQQDYNLQQQSIYTIRSQQLMNEVLQNGYFEKPVNHKNLFSDEEMALFEKQHSKKYDSVIQREQKMHAERLYNDSKHLKEKKEYLREIYNQDQQKKCPFFPQLISSGYIKIREENFYEHQKKRQLFHEKNIENLKKERVEEAEQQMQNKPNLNQKSQKLASQILEKKGLPTNVVKRLYQEKEVKPCEYKPENYLFRPQISEHNFSTQRPEKIQEFLYQDAQRRAKEKNKKTEENQELPEKGAGSQQNVQDKYHDLIMSKFDKQFKKAVQSLALSTNPNRTVIPDTLTYLEMVALMQNMCFLEKNEQNNQQQLTIQVQKVWNQLSQQKKNIILVRNLEVFLFAVQKINCKEDFLPFLTSEQVRFMHNLKVDFQEIYYSSQNPIGQFDENDNLYYSDEQVQQIHKLFKNLYDNRLVYLNSNQRTYKHQPQQYTFNPEISDVSRGLAEEKKQKIIEQMKQVNNLNDFDINQKLIYQKQLTNNEIAQKKNILNQLELSQCTFHPTIKDFTNVQNLYQSGDKKLSTTIKSLGAHRTIELFSLSKPRNQRRDRNKDDVEYEKECDECTFSPDIKRFQKNNYSSYSQWDLEKLMLIFKKEGNNQSLDTDERVPLLFVDVNIEDGKTARIVVYEGEKSEDLANKFAKEHNLDPQMIGRLKDLLDQQINSLLTKIDEEQGSEKDDDDYDEMGNRIHRRQNQNNRMNDLYLGITYEGFSYEAYKL